MLFVLNILKCFFFFYVCVEVGVPGLVFCMLGVWLLGVVVVFGLFGRAGWGLGGVGIERVLGRFWVRFGSFGRVRLDVGGVGIGGCLVGFGWGGVWVKVLIWGMSIWILQRFYFTSFRVASRHICLGFILVLLCFTSCILKDVAIVCFTVLHALWCDRERWGNTGKFHG